MLRQRPARGGAQSLDVNYETSVASKHQPQWRAGRREEHRWHNRLEDGAVKIHPKLHEARCAHKARTFNDATRGFAILWRRVRAAPATIKVDFDMLGSDDDIHPCPIGYTRGQKLTKGSISQRALNVAADHIDIAEKCSGGLIDRRIVDVIGRTVLHNAPLSHQGNFVGHAHRFTRFMGDQEDGSAFIL